MNWQAHTKAVTRRCSIKKVFLKIAQNLQKNTCAWASFLTKLQAEASDFIKNETLAQVSSCEFCEIFTNTFLKEHTEAASAHTSTYTQGGVAL